MKQILSNLCRLPGVSGALLASSDGLLIAAETSLGGREAEDTAAAVVGNLGRSARDVLARLGGGEMKHMVVSGAGGRAAVAACEAGYLVALLDGEVNLGLVQLELSAAAARAARKMAL